MWKSELKELCYGLLNKCFSIPRSKSCLIWGTICACYCRAQSEFISKIALNSRASDFASTADSRIWSKFGILSTHTTAVIARVVQTSHPE